MLYSKVSRLPVIAEDASEEVAEIYTEIKRVLQVPEVPNIMKALAVSPGILATHWSMVRALYQHITLPESLVSMIFFTIAQVSNCKYCSAAHEVACRTLGVDEQTLSALVKDLDHVSPRRLQAIIEFAVNVALDPQGLQQEDYDRLRQEGITDQELVEILYIGAIARYSDILADALKVEVDAAVAQALGR